MKFSEDAMFSAEKEFQNAASHFDYIDWSRASAWQASVERNNLFRSYMKIQRLALAKGGPGQNYLRGYQSQYEMRVNGAAFLSTGVSVGAKGSLAHARQKGIAAERSRSVKSYPRIESALGKPAKPESSRVDDLSIVFFPGGVSYVDKSRKENGDYVRCAFMDYRTLTLKFYPKCRPEMRSMIERHAASLQAKRGQRTLVRMYQISASGHMVVLGNLSK